MFTNQELQDLNFFLSNKQYDVSTRSASGHAIGEPIEKSIYDFLKQRDPEAYYKQYELLNILYYNNPNYVGSDRLYLLPNNALRLLLNRGVQATVAWSQTNLFVEKQNDTADIIKLLHKDVYGIIDIKTFDTLRQGQPPNIISAYKLAQLCSILIQEPESSKTLNVCYYSVAWKFNSNSKIEVIGTHLVDLFKINPQKLYINWAAAMQIQFHPHVISQDFNGTKLEWALEYLKVYCQSAQERINTMESKFLRPFQNIINN